MKSLHLVFVTIVLFAVVEPADQMKAGDMLAKRLKLVSMLTCLPAAIFDVVDSNASTV